MIYGEAVKYIANIERAGSDYGIERTRYLLDLLGAPDGKLKIIHVAGTNGKGSVTAYLTSILKEAGYRVGTYNSPSVFRYNERWLINGEALSDDGVAKYITEVRDVIVAENGKRKNQANRLPKTPLFSGTFQPTAFEIETAVAMLAFVDEKCDVAVLETGLGGRWDATNAVREKDLAVITPIGLDHCALLGNTLGEIAEEKSAIIRDDAVTCEQSDGIMRAIRHPYVLDGDGNREYVVANVRVCKTPRLLSCDEQGQTFEYGDSTYRIGMLGAHQLQNASIAVCATEVLREKNYAISERALCDGLERAVWHARLEIVKDAQKRFNIYVPQGKTLVFDGAHNPHGANALADAIKTYFAGKRVHLVMGILKDKDVDGVIGILAPLADRVTAITPASSRALDKSILKEKASAYAPCDVGEDVRSALTDALAGECDVVILCGSLTLFGGLTKEIQEA